MAWSKMLRKFAPLVSSFGLLFTFAAAPSFAADEQELTKFLAAYSPEDQQAISNLLDEYRKTGVINEPIDAKRQLFGNDSAPTSVLEWIDIQCPHCKNLNSALEELKQMTPPNSWRVELRHYPLDNECNPAIPSSRKPGVSCLAAKVMICLSGKPNAQEVRNQLFDQQRILTKEMIWNTAASNADELNGLKSCVDSPATAATLKADIDLAEKHQISGTPLVVINGKQAPSAPPIIYALILADGNPDAKPFQSLPAPKPMPKEEGHEGHNH